MRDLTKAFAMIRLYEGLRLKSYPDPASGNVPWTIGYGSTVVNGSAVRPGMVCLLAQAESWMEDDAHKRAATIDSWLKVPCSDSQMCALVSLAYNIGLGGLYHSQLLSDMNSGKPAPVCAADFMHYIHAAGQVLPGLIKRRKAESALFLTESPKHNQGVSMSLSTTLTAQLAVIATDQTTVLTTALTQAFNDGVASVSSPTGDVTSAQEVIDIAAAVKAAVDPLNATIAASALAKTTEDALLAAVKVSAAALLASLG